MSEDINLDETALHLLGHIATRGDTKTKGLISETLYNKPTVNLKLLEVAEEFGKTLASGEDAQRLAEALTKDVRLQVQHLSSDEEFQKPTVSLAQMTLTGGPTKVAVSLDSDVALRAIIAHRKLLPQESIRALIDSVLDTFREPDNILANKVLMINAITGLADVLTTELADKAFAILEPIACGNVTSIDLSKVIAPNHPLNPNTMNLGSSSTVQAGALLALATIQGSLSDEYRTRVSPMIEEGMTNPDPEVRTFAFIAARRTKELSDSAIMRAVLATRDPVQDILIEAFLLLSDHVMDTREFWSSLTYSMKIASQSPQSEIRRVVAYTTTRVAEKCTDEAVRAQLDEIRNSLENDISFSVRRELTAVVQ